MIDEEKSMKVLQEALSKTIKEIAILKEVKSTIKSAIKAKKYIVKEMKKIKK